MYFILLSALCVYVCVCACVYFDVWIWIVHACIYSRTIAVPANVFVEFDPTLNKDYLILSYLMFPFDDVIMTGVYTLDGDRKSNSRIHSAILVSASQIWWKIPTLIAIRLLQIVAWYHSCRVMRNILELIIFENLDQIKHKFQLNLSYDGKTLLKWFCKLERKYLNIHLTKYGLIIYCFQLNFYNISQGMALLTLRGV